MDSPNSNGRNGGRLSLGFFLGLALVLGAPSARANTYLFSVTGGEILSAMAATTEFPDNITSSGYFAIFLQPYEIGTFTYGSETAPITGAPATAWEASTITDYANLGDGTWARFSKQQNQAQVAILSNADPGSGNIWLNYTHYDNATWPIAWGSTTGQIVEILSESATFQFTINTTGTLSGTYFLLGNATSVFSTSPLSVASPKTEPNITFLMEVTPSYIPEPSTWLVALSGLVLLALRVARARGVPARD